MSCSLVGTGWPRGNRAVRSPAACSGAGVRPGEGRHCCFTVSPRVQRQLLGSRKVRLTSVKEAMGLGRCPTVTRP